EVEAAPHATGVGTNEPAGGIRKTEALQELGGPGGDPPAREVGKAADQAQVLAAGEVRVDSGVLARKADAIADGVRFANHVVAEDLGVAVVWTNDRSQDTHGSGLAGAVGAEQA